MKKEKNSVFLFKKIITWILIVMLLPSAALAEWTTSGAVANIQELEGFSMEVDSLGNIHYLLLDYPELLYATDAYGSVAVEPLDTCSNGTDISITVDTGNKAHISYLETGTEYLKYGTNKSGTWVTERVSGPADYRASKSVILIDSTDKPHILFIDLSDGTGKVMHAVRIAELWTVETVLVGGSSINGTALSAAIDSFDKLHFALYQNNDKTIKHFSNTSGYWAAETVDINIDKALATSLDTDHAGNTHIAYRAISVGASSRVDVKYAKNTSGQWETEVIEEDVPFFILRSYVPISIVLDSKDTIHITYDREDSGIKGNQRYSNVKYVTNSSGMWTSEIIAGIFNSIFPVMAADSADNIYIAFGDERRVYSGGDSYYFYRVRHVTNRYHQVPQVDIKANGSDAPITIAYGTPLKIEVSLAPNSRTGAPADWWVKAETPINTYSGTQLYWYQNGSGWKNFKDPLLAYNGVLRMLSPFTVFNSSSLQRGVYRFHFAIDEKMDSLLDGTWQDSVRVTIE